VSDRNPRLKLCRIRMMIKAAWNRWEVRAVCENKEQFRKRYERYLDNGFAAEDLMVDIEDEIAWREELRLMREELELLGRRQYAY